MKVIKIRYLFIISSFLLLTTSCKVQKQFSTPQVAKYTSFSVESDTTCFADTEWWDFFKDPILKKLIKRGLENNLSLKSKVIALKQSHLQMQIAGAQLYPAVNYGITGESSYNTLSANISNQMLAATNVSYTLDLWGKISQQNEAALQSYLATEMAYYQVQATLISQIATLYFTLRDIDNKLLVTQQMIDALQEFKNIIDARYQGGFISKVDVNQIYITIKEAEVTMNTLERVRKQLENALSLALSDLPQNIERGLSLQEQVFLPKLPVGIPVSILQRRPSILLIEKKIKVQLANIGVTEALKYPNLTLSLNAGTQITSPTMLFSQLIAQLTGPIFNKGKITNTIALEEEKYNQLENEYRQTYLEALQEIEDALIAIKTYKNEVDIRKEQLQLAQEALDLAWVRYNEGVTSFLEFLNLQKDLFSAQLQASESYKLQLQSVVKLYLALGGGWKKKNVLTE